MQGNRRSLILTVCTRMLLLPILFLPICVGLGFRGQTLCAFMVLFSAPAAVALYSMAIAMDADGQMAGQLVCATTLVSMATFLYISLYLKLLISYNT